METILATAFGRVINVQQGESSQLTEAAAEIFAGGHEGKPTSQKHLIALLSMYYTDIANQHINSSGRVHGYK